MIPSAGTTCLFTFITKFSTINGVYQVTASTTFTNAIASGISFVDNLYTPAGLSVNDYNTDYSTYTNDAVCVLQSVTDPSVVYYVPESIFQTVPDPTINEYYNLILVVRLGVQQNTQAVFPLIDAVKDLVQASLGTTDPVRIMTNPGNKVYLTDTQYAALVAERASNIQVLSPLSVQLKAEQDRNTYLASKVAYYEALIAQT
jgi:hypothetical protein